MNAHITDDNIKWNKLRSWLAEIWILYSISFVKIIKENTFPSLSLAFLERWKIMIKLYNYDMLVMIRC